MPDATLCVETRAEGAPICLVEQVRTRQPLRFERLGIRACL